MRVGLLLNGQTRTHTFAILLTVSTPVSQILNDYTIDDKMIGFLLFCVFISAMPSSNVIYLNGSKYASMCVLRKRTLAVFKSVITRCDVP